MPGRLPNTRAHSTAGIHDPTGVNRRDFACLCARVQRPGATPGPGRYPIFQTVVIGVEKPAALAIKYSIDPEG